jgi:hypothetical protein
LINVDDCGSQHMYSGMLGIILGSYLKWIFEEGVIVDLIADKKIYFFEHIGVECIKVDASTISALF